MDLVLILNVPHGSMPLPRHRAASMILAGLSGSSRQIAARVRTSTSRKRRAKQRLERHSSLPCVITCIFDPEIVCFYDFGGHTGSFLGLDSTTKIFLIHSAYLMYCSGFICFFTDFISQCRQAERLRRGTWKHGKLR